MTRDQVSTLSKLLELSTEARPSVSPEGFMQVHWLPFIHNLAKEDRHMAWQVYLKTQVKHVHAIAEHLQTLTPSQLRVLHPLLENLSDTTDAIRKLGEVRAVA
ncbi:MAG: hypothetical protein JNJ90_02130 [Saprospiraceae bacterium]|jgi:hypothetical protein|nr:hypothetical protein [Saprospiraceae bacterium]